MAGTHKLILEVRQFYCTLNFRSFLKVRNSRWELLTPNRSSDFVHFYIFGNRATISTFHVL